MSKLKKKEICSKHECLCNKILCFCDTFNAPFMDKLPENLSPGTCITINGWIKEDCARFAVNLVCSEEGDVALHVNPRLFQKYIMRSSRIKGQWRVPEVTSLARFELTKNRAFQLSILLTSREFLIAVDGKYFCGYVYRFSPDLMKLLQVFGSVKVNKVTYQDLAEYPPESLKTNPTMLTLGSNLFKPTGGKVELPLTAFLVKGFRNGFQIEINGRIKKRPCGFFINLQEGSRIWPLPNLHLHVDFSFSLKNGEHSVLVNTRFDQVWRSATHVPRLYFQPNADAHIAIHRIEDQFTIRLDGEVLEYIHVDSKNADLIDTLYIQGDIHIHPPINITIRK